jgi:PTH2 family peptidyl-tRNA hydrolase
MKQVIVYRKDLNTSKGKMAAQVGHAAVCAAKASELKDFRVTEKWFEELMMKIVLEIDGDECMTALERIKQLYNICTNLGLPCFLVVDAGRTEIDPGTVTCLGIGPCDAESIDAVTGHLKLFKDEDYTPSLLQRIKGFFR